MLDLAYPPSPAQLPPRLTALTGSYQLRASLAVAAILLFFLLFAALVAALGWLVWLAVSYPMATINKFTILAKLGAIAGSLMLFAFTLKFAFKLRNHVPENRIELKRAQQPRLFAFVDRICAETRAPRPRKIHVDPDVNAYVAYTNTWLSLFLPVRKDLTIGLGLVSILDRSEFKAVVAHEFGHFAQRSMRIGSYIVSANTIIHDMIYSRDKWDEALEQWRGADLRLSFAAWIITPLIWAIRRTLALFYVLLNRLHASLSREMEFNADKVAVSTSGSEAIISALWKLDDGERHWRGTLNGAYLAAQKNLFVADLYHHNDLAIGREAAQLRDRRLALPEDPRGGRRFFVTSEHSKVGMYASHPPNDQREQSAKQPFVACAHDHEPAWTLFDEREALCQAMTGLVYAKYLDKQPKEHAPSAAFEQFTAAEQQGADLLGELQGTYANRFVNLPADEELERACADSGKAETPEAVLARLPALMGPVVEMEALMQKAQLIAQGATSEAAFSFQGARYEKKNLQAGWDALVAAREAEFNGSLKAWDADYFTAHYRLAARLGGKEELRARYAQHRAITGIYQALVGAHAFALSEVQRLQAMKDATDAVVRIAIDDINGRVAEANRRLKELAGMPLAPLTNIDTTAELVDAIIQGGSIREGSMLMFGNGDFGRLMKDLERAMNHCQRVEQKSLIGMLQAHSGLKEASATH